MAITKVKRKKLEDLIYNTFSILDKTGENVKKYRAKFSVMNDKEFEAWFKKFFASEDNQFYFEIIPFKNEPKMDQLKKAANFLKIPLEEYVYKKHLIEGKVVRTPERVPVGFLMIKKLQQFLDKKNAISHSIDQRSMKYNQVTGKDKVAGLTNEEIFALSAINADRILEELRGPRADDEEKKVQMYQKISKDGNVYLNDLSSDIEKKATLNTVDTYLLGMGIKSDLITPSLVLRKTMSESGDIFNEDHPIFSYFNPDINTKISTNSIILLDFDNTICFNEYDTNQPDKIVNDQINLPMVLLVKNAYKLGARIEILTMRKKVAKENIKNWLREKEIPFSNINCLGLDEEMPSEKFYKLKFEWIKKTLIPLPINANIFFFDDNPDFLLAFSSEKPEGYNYYNYDEIVEPKKMFPTDKWKNIFLFLVDEDFYKESELSPEIFLRDENILLKNDILGNFYNESYFALKQQKNRKTKYVTTVNDLYFNNILITQDNHMKYFMKKIAGKDELITILEYLSSNEDFHFLDVIPKVKLSFHLSELNEKEKIGYMLSDSQYFLGLNFGNALESQWLKLTNEIIVKTELGYEKRYLVNIKEPLDQIKLIDEKDVPEYAKKQFSNLINLVNKMDNLPYFSVNRFIRNFIDKKIGE